ncbi:MAG: tyrosine-type recombinase/integrase [Erysipelotrichaceae bacterium]
MAKTYPITTKDEITKIESLLELTSPMAYTMWILGSTTGYRISDLSELTVNDVKGSRLSLVEKKTKKVRTVPVAPKLKRTLNKWIAKMGLSDNDFLFPSSKKIGSALSIRRFQQIFKKVSEIVATSYKFSTHSMRKTFAYNLYKATNNIALVMESLNHSSQEITLKYLCANEIEGDIAIMSLYA